MPYRMKMQACASHAPLARWGQVVDTMADARAAVGGDLAYLDRYRDSLPPDFLWLAAVDTDKPCCATAGFARYLMAAAWREALTQLAS